MISIIIPVFNEEKILKEFLDSLFSQIGSYEVIIVDGGSTDKTWEIASSYSKAQVIKANKGRGSQMNAGAKLAKADWLLFLHADTFLSPNTINKLSELIINPSFKAACFWHKFDSLHPWLQIVSLIHNLRFRATKTIYGDQCLFIEQKLFQELGGFRENIVMEDIEISQRILSLTTPVCLPLSAITSSRKFYSLGIYRSTLRVLKLMYIYGRKDAKQDLFFSDIR